jgi:geranylgeranylglycerol-phosphate geranylgeranyltransferase
MDQQLARELERMNKSVFPRQVLKWLSGEGWQPEGEPSVLELFVRATAYAATSLCAHISGYLLQARPRSWSDSFLIAALWLTSLPFFLDYAISYHVDDHLQDEQAKKWASLNARKLLPSGVVVLTAFCIVSYKASTGLFPQPSFWILLFAFAIMFWSYGRYTVRLAEREPASIRHRLVWPVIFSIAVPLYSGVIFSEKRYDLFIFVSPACLVFFFFATFRLSRRVFVISSIAPLVLILIFSVIGYPNHIESFANLTFYLVLAAFLAVFEAWGITASLALTEADVPQTAQGETTTPPLPKSASYYLASLVALCTAALSLPLLYTFSDYGRIFFIGMIIYAPLTFSTWYWAGDMPSRLRTNTWIAGKTLVGFLFLAILVVDALLNFAPDNRWMPAFVNMSIFQIELVIVVAAIGYCLRQIGGTDLRYWWRRLRIDRSGVLVLTLLLALIMSFGTLVVVQFQGPSDVILFKADRVFIFYFATILIISLLLFIRGGSRLPVSLLGVMLSARIFTSSIIGLAVLLPALRSGVRFMDGVFSALPFFLASAAGFLLNDVCDYERDRISKPFRPLPRGLVSPRAASLAGLALAIGACTVMLLSSPAGVCQVVQGAAIVGVILYNLVVAKVGWLKGPFAALLCMLPLVYVINRYGYPSSFWWIVVGGYCFSVGREILMDILDLEGDKSTGLRTLPMVIGVVQSECLGCFCVTLAALGLFAFRRSTEVTWQQMVLDAALIFLLILGVFWYNTEAISRRRYIVRFAWVPMLLALAAFL